MSRVCKQPGCERTDKICHGYCGPHYSRMRRGADMTAPITNPKATPFDRFWSKVDKAGDCWVWTGATFNGYGAFRHKGSSHVAHRISYEWKHGPIPPGAEVDHMCFNRGCVNPDHLRLLSHSLNGQNRAGANSNSKSGVRGVYWCNTYNTWLAKAMLNRKAYGVGRFATVEEAEQAITEWRREHMPYSINDQRKAV